MATDPFEQARRERSLLRGLWEMTPLGSGFRALSDLFDYAEREKASESLLGDYLTALEPVQEIGSDLFKSGQMVGNAIQAGSGTIAGLLGKGLDPYSMMQDPGSLGAYGESYAKRLRDQGTGEPDILDIGRTLEAAPGPGDVMAEAALPNPEGAVGRVGKLIGSQAGNLVFDPSNLALGGLPAAMDAVKAGRLADAAAKVIGSPVAGAVYAPELLSSIAQSGEAALDPTLPMAQRIEAGVQGGLTAGLGGLMAHGIASEIAPRTISERVALKREAKAQGMDDVPPPAQPVPQEAPVPQGVEPEVVRNEPQMIEEPQFEPRRPVAPIESVVRSDNQPILDNIEPAREPVQPEPMSMQRGQEPVLDEAPAPDLVVAPEPRPADIEPSIPPVEAAPASPDIPFRFPLDEVAPEVRPHAEEVATALSGRFADDGRFDQVALDEVLAANPDLAPHAEAIKSQAVQEAAAVIQGRDLLEDIRSYHPPDGPDGVESIPVGEGGFDIVQRKNGEIIGAAQIRDGELKMVAGGRKMGSPESIRPVYEAIDAAGAIRNDALTVLGAQARRTAASRAGETRLAPSVPVEAGAQSAGPVARAGDAGRVRAETEKPAAHPLDRDEPLPVRNVIDTVRQRLAQHERTRAPEATVAHDLGSAVYHVVASGLKRSLPQVRGWVKRHLGTWLRKVGFAGEKLNKAIASAYEAAQARWTDYRARLRDPLSDPAQRGSTSSVRKADKPVMSREEIDRQLRSNPELRGMARAQLESISKSAKKPMARLNTEDISKAIPGDDPQSRASRALLNRVAAMERLAEPVEAGDTLTQQLQASLAAPVKAGPKRLDNPRSKSGKVREERPYQAPTPETTKAVAESVQKSALPEATKRAVAAKVAETGKAVGHGEILTLDDIDAGVRGALKLRTEADLKRLLKGRKVTQAEVAAFKLTLQDQKIESFKHLTEWRAAKGDEAKANAQEAYLQSQLKQAENLRAFAGDTVGAARISRARHITKQSDAVKKLFESLRPDTKELLTPKQASQLASLIDEVMKGHRQASDLAEAIQAATRPSAIDKVLEFVKAGMLSAPPTHFANAVGNMTSALLDLSKTGMAGLIDPIIAKRQGRAQERFMSDVGASLVGMRSALPKAMSQFANDIADMATLKPEKFDLNSGLFEHQVGAIEGLKGRVIRTPFRLLGAADAFFRHILNSSEQMKEANRAAESRIQKGTLRREQKGAFMENWLEDLRDPANAQRNEAVVARIDREVRKGLFQQEHGDFAKMIQKLLSGPLKLAQLKIPFFSTPVNIIRTLFRYSPPGLLEAGNRMRNLTDAAERGEILDDMAKGAVGSAITLGLMSLAAQGLITGSGPSDPKERSALMQTGWRPYSLKYGGTYIPMERVEPFGSILGISADIVEMAEGDMGDAFGKSVGIIKNNVLNKSWFQGLADIINTVSDHERNSEKFVANVAASFVPNIAARLAQGMDPIYRDTKGEGDNPGLKILDASVKAMRAKVPGMSEDLKARKAITGEDMQRGGSAVSRFLLPSQLSEDAKTEESTVAKELIRIRYTPPPPRKYVELDGRRINLTPEEYARLEQAKVAASKEAFSVMQQEAYRQAKDTVEEGGQASKEAILQNIYRGYQERARNELYRLPRLNQERRKIKAQRMPNVRIKYRDR